MLGLITEDELMMSKIKNLVLFGVGLGFLVACAPAQDSNSTSSSDDSANETMGVYSWKSVYFDWKADEVPEDACREGRVTITSDRTLEVRDCGKVRRAKLIESDFAAFEKEIDFVISSLKRPITCNGDAIADYAQNWNLVTDAGETVEFYQFDIENSCGRVQDVNELNDFLYDLKEEYFPRVEEGEYQE